MAAMNLLLSYGAEVTPGAISCTGFEGAYAHYQRIHKLVALLDSSQTKLQFSRQSLMLRFAVTEMRRCRNWRQNRSF